MGRSIGIALSLVFCLPGLAQANMGLPTIVPFGYLVIVALVPLIAVEAGVPLARLDIGFVEALGVSALDTPRCR